MMSKPLLKKTKEIPNAGDVTRRSRQAREGGAFPPAETPGSRFELLRQQRGQHVREYCDYLLSVVPDVITEAQEQGQGYGIIHEIHFPKKELNGRHKHKLNETHFGGLDENGALLDEFDETKSTPFISLVNGPLGADHRADPSLLPGGLTAIDLLSRNLESKGYRVETLNNRGALAIYLIWDQDSWRPFYSSYMENERYRGFYDRRGPRSYREEDSASARSDSPARSAVPPVTPPSTVTSQVPPPAPFKPKGRKPVPKVQS